MDLTVRPTQQFNPTLPNHTILHYEKLAAVSKVGISSGHRPVAPLHLNIVGGPIDTNTMTYEADTEEPEPYLETLQQIKNVNPNHSIRLAPTYPFYETHKPAPGRPIFPE